MFFYLDPRTGSKVGFPASNLAVSSIFPVEDWQRLDSLLHLVNKLLSNSSSFLGTRMLPTLNLTKPNTNWANPKRSNPNQSSAKGRAAGKLLLGAPATRLKCFGRWWQGPILISYRGGLSMLWTREWGWGRSPRYNELNNGSKHPWNQSSQALSCRVGCAPSPISSDQIDFVTYHLAFSWIFCCE